MSPPSNGSYPTKEQIQAASQEALTHVDVKVPEWNNIVIPVCRLTAGDHSKYRATLATFKQKLHEGKMSEGELEMHMDRMETFLCYLAMRNPSTGQRLFRSENEVAALEAGGLQRVYKEASKLNKLNQEAVEEAGEGSGEIPTGLSPTPSPEIEG